MMMEGISKIPVWGDPMKKNVVIYAHCACLMGEQKIDVTENC